MAITGTGSATDPFIVSTWQELADTASNSDGPSNRYIKFAEDIVINLDDYYTDYAPRVSQKVDTTCHIDFNRAIIINGRFDKIFGPPNHGMSYPLYISNAVILNSRVDSTTGMCNVGASSYAYFEDCVFDVHLPLPDASFTGIGGANQFTRCKVTVNGNGLWCNSQYTTYNDCIIDIRLNTHTSSTAGITYTPFDEESVTINNHAGIVTGLKGVSYIPVCRDCHIVGRLDSTEGSDDKTVLRLIPYNCIIETDCDIVAPRNGGVVLCNSDKATLASSVTIGSTTATATGPLHKRTTEEIRNQQVLYDLGFSANPNSIAN